MRSTIGSDPAPGGKAASREGASSTRFGLLFLAPAIVLLSVVLVLLPVPVEEVAPRRDSGVFLYAGQQILAGKVPYLDVWDHKGPLIYTINALGLLLASGERWGVWAIQFLSLLTAGLASLFLFRAAVGWLSAIAGTVTWLMAVPALLQGGNLTEEYALPLQFTALLLFYQGIQRRSVKLFWFVGATCALAMLLRPNIVGVWLAVGLYLLLGAREVKERRFYIHSLGALALGTAAILALPLGYFAFHGALDEFVSAALVYNLVYVDASLSEQMEAVRYGLSTASDSLLWPATFFWVFSLAALAFGRHKPTKTEPLVTVALLAFPVELFLSSLSGRIYDHYYLSWLPVLGLLAAYFYRTNVIGALQQGGKRRPSIQWPVTLLAAGVAVLAVHALGQQIDANVNRAVFAAEGIGDAISGAPLDDAGFAKIAEGSSGALLFWGAESAQHFLLGAPSPTRYVYQYPLYDCTYAQPDMVAEFMGDIVQHQPLIIDTSATTGRVPPIDPERRAAWMAASPSFQERTAGCPFPDSFAPLFSYLRTHYVEAGSYGAQAWPVYAPLAGEGD